MIAFGLLAVCGATEVTIPVQGTLIDATGVPAEGVRAVTATLRTEGGAVVHTESLAVRFIGGGFHAVLGAGAATLEDTDFAQDLWLTFTLDGVASDAVPVGWAPRAAFAARAAEAGHAADADAVGGQSLAMLDDRFAALIESYLADYLPGTGGLTLGDSSAACDAGTEGTLRYATAAHRVEVCDGTDWTPIGAGAAGDMSTVCDAGNAGVTRYNPATQALELCDGTSFGPISLDTTPNAFTLTPSGTIGVNSVIASNTVTVTGVDVAVAVSVSGEGSPQININGGGWVTSGTITPGQTLQVRLTSANTTLTTRVATVSVGRSTVTYTVSTPNALYAFTSHTFTNCGQTGRSGPNLAQCQAAYSGASWASDSSYFQVNAGVQRWTAPVSGTYRVEAWGARGGNNSAGAAGGIGARIRGDLTLTQGQQLRILVGQAGTDFTSQAGGGGGTYVVRDSDGAALIIAGGGGGAHTACSTHHGSALSTGQIAGYGTQASGGAGGPGYDAGGGGGFTGNGGYDRVTTYPGTATFGLSFLNGGSGGQHLNGSDGGFGGGGASHSGQNAGGGGGGYNGGGGGYTPNNCGAGGSSYNIGANPVNTGGDSLSNPPTHGSVTITRL